MVLALMPASMVAAAHAPEARDTDHICESDDPSDYESAFADVGSGPHWVNIVCMADLEITEGVGDGTNYAPRQEVTRGQMASFVVRFVEHATGEEMPEGDPDRFDDVPATDAQYVHATNIHKLAEADIVRGTAASGGDEFAPQRPVNRMQMGSFIRHALSWMDDGEARNDSAPPAATHDWFPDPSAAEHEDNVDAIAEVGIVEGFEDGTYGPTRSVLRDQMASFIMRAYDYAIEAGLTEAAGTNQTFTVTPDDVATNPTDGSRDYEVTDFGDVDEVVIALAEAANVHEDNGWISFDTSEDNGDFTADFGDVEATVSDVAVDGTAVAGFDDGDSVSVDSDSVVAFTVNGGNEDESVVPVVYAPGDDDELPTDDAGEPEHDFGIGGTKHFVDVAELVLTQEDDTNLFGTEHSVTATLEDADGDPVTGLEGQQITFEVEHSDSFPWSGCDFGDADISAEGFSETVDVVDGQAVLTYMGPDDPDPDAFSDALFDCISAHWDGAGSYDGEEATAEGNDAVVKEWSNGLVTNERTGDVYSNFMGWGNGALGGDADLEPGDELTAVGMFRENVTVNESVTITGDDAHIEGTGGTVFTIDGDASDVTIQGFEIDFDLQLAFRIQGDDATVVDNVLEAGEEPDEAFDIDGADRVTISGNEITVEEADTTLILVEDGDDASISGNVIDVDVVDTSRLIALQESDGATFSDNVIAVDDLDGNEVLRVDEANGVTISGNTITVADDDGDGIIIHHREGDDLTIADNVLDGGATGIALVTDTGSETLAVTGNQISADEVGILVDDEGADGVEISANVITGHETGIEVDSSAENVSITDNTISGNDRGVDVSTDDDAPVVENNTFGDNDPEHLCDEEGDSVYLDAVLNDNDNEFENGAEVDGSCIVPVNS